MLRAGVPRHIRRDDPRFWNRIAPVYEVGMRLTGWDRARRRLARSARGRVLDAGCGTGDLARFLAARGHEVVAVDRSSGMIREAVRRTEQSDAPHFVRADVRRLPFTSNTFDTVICTGVLGLLAPADRGAALAELARVSRGRLLLLESFATPDAGWLGRHLPRLLDGRAAMTPAEYHRAGLSVTVLRRVLAGTYAALDVRVAHSAT